MGSIGGAEILIVLLVALIVLGPARLPQAARQLGRAMSEFRRMTAGFQAELRDTLDAAEPAPPPPPPPGEWKPAAESDQPPETDLPDETAGRDRESDST